MATGAPYWAWGLVVLLGGLLLVLAAAGGWSHLAEGVANVIYFWR